MSDGKKYYCFCSSNCKYETMTKEQILAAITQAITTGVVGDVDTGFVTKLQEQNRRDAVTMWVGTQAQYNALPSIANNCLYIITDDTTNDDIMRAVADAQEKATAAEANAAAALNHMARINITNQIDFEVDSAPEGLTLQNVMHKEFVYIPAYEMVFFNLQLMITGTFTGDGTLSLKQTGYQKAYLGSSACASSNPHISATYSGTGDSTRLTISPYKNDFVIDNPFFIISGWYFCKGE
jgi:hypothetical protein